MPNETTRNQIPAAIAHRVIMGIVRAAALQDHGSCLRTYGIIGKLEYLYFESGLTCDLDACKEGL